MVTYRSSYKQFGPRGVPSVAPITPDIRHRVRFPRGTYSFLTPRESLIDAGCIIVGTLDASLVYVINLSASRILVGTLDASLVTLSNLNASSITAGTIDASVIRVGSLDARNLIVGTTQIVTSGWVYPKAILQSKIADAAIGSLQLAALAVYNAKIAVDSIYGSVVKAQSIGTRALVDSSVIANKISDAAVGSSKIVTGAVYANKLAGSAVTTAKLEANAITSNKILANAVVAAKLAGSAVIASKIAANAITGNKIAANAVSAGKVTTGTLLTLHAQIAAAIIGNSHIGSLSANKITAGSIAAGYIKAGTFTGGNFIVGSQGVIKSSDYSPETAGFRLDAYHGIEVNVGTFPTRVFQKAYAYGTYLEVRDTTRRKTTLVNTWAKLKEFKISRSGSLTIRARMSLEAYNQMTYKIYRSGTPVIVAGGRVVSNGGEKKFGSAGYAYQPGSAGSEWGPETGSFRNFDIPGWRGGDTVEIWAKQTQTPGSAVCYDFALYTANPTSAQVHPLY